MLATVSKSMAAMAVGFLVMTSGAEAFALKLPKPTASLPSAGTIRLSGPAKTPFGAAFFCSATKSECAVRSARRVRTERGRVVLDAAMLSALQDVNRSVNRAIRPRNDNGFDVWQVGVAAGDCEDYALTKRSRLIKMGLPSSAVLVATVDAPGYGGHAVLVVRTDRGDFVLDNMRSDIRGWDRTGYTFKTIQSPNNPRSWRRV